MEDLPIFLTRNAGERERTPPPINRGPIWRVAVLLWQFAKPEISIKTFAHSISYFLGTKTDPNIMKPFSCSTQHSMKFFLLINVKMPTIVGILIFMSRTK